MSLQVWLPLTKDLRNQGLSNVTVTNNGATFNSAGKLGGCYEFASGKRIQTTLPASTSLNTKAISFACWMYVTSWNSAYDCFMSIADGTSWVQSRATLCRNNTASTLTWNIADGTNRAYVTTATALSLNTWTHVAGTYDGTNLKIYINGVLNNTSATTLSIGYAGTFNIGGWSGNNYPFNGRLNDVRIYNHCLSQMEVKELAKGLVLHYPLNRQGWGQENLLSRYVVPGQAAPTSTAAGGRTTWLGDYKITIPATENADTYFRLFTSKQLTVNSTYTISCKVDGLLDGTYYRFPLYAQGNTSMGVLTLDHNGLCSLTFTMTYGTQTAATGANGETVYICFMDDSARAIASGQGAITISNFKLEEGSAVTPWCPNSSDALATTMGLNSTTEYDCSGYCNNGTYSSRPDVTSDTPKYDVSSLFGAYNTPNLIVDTAATLCPALSNCTIAWWQKSNGAATLLLTGQTTSYYVAASNANNYYHQNAGSPIMYRDSVAGTYQNTTGTWHHYVLTGVNLSTWTTIKVNSYASGWPVNGYISDLRIYATALSADDVKSLYNNSAYIDSSGNIYGAIIRE